jgi:hypothetical protein
MDEGVCELHLGPRPYFQFSTGEEFFQHAFKPIQDIFYQPIIQDIFYQTRCSILPYGGSSAKVDRIRLFCRTLWHRSLRIAIV